MDVVATAGHVDHGKSTLVQALTGMDPDRWAEEKERGLTIDLGFAWTSLPSGREVAFVDVPGHERFLTNMLAGVGPASVVCFVVAADKGWQAQSTDHRDAILALGIEHGLVVITRADLAEDGGSATKDQVRAQLGGTALADAPIVTVSATTGAGLDDLRSRLDEVLAAASPDSHARVRMWIDRSFTIRGSGTVVTGTLGAGTLTAGDRVDLLTADGTTRTAVRGLQSRGSGEDAVTAAARVAVNLRDVAVADVHRGDALTTPGAWQIVDEIDVRRSLGRDLTEAPREVAAHIGTASLTATVRAFDDAHARLRLSRPLPLRLGDRIVLRAPGSAQVIAGVVVLDVDVPTLDRRGDGPRRAAALAALPVTGDARAEVVRRGAIEVDRLARFGVDCAGAPGQSRASRVPDGLEELRLASAAWWIDPAAMAAWARLVTDAVTAKLAADPLAPGLAQGAIAGALVPAVPPVPSPSLIPRILAVAGLETADGVVRPPGHQAGLGVAEASVAEVERRLAASPFAAPEADELDDLGLGNKELAAAEKAGRLLRLPDGIVILPKAPAQAMRILAGLTQPFTTSEARQALGTTRRVAIPLLEHLDARRWTRRLDGNLREVRR